MPEILPIRPWRYNQSLSQSIDSLTSPLFDVVSEKQRKALYQHPYNSIHMSVPQETPGAAGKRLAQWKHQGILVQDRLPGIYVYYQYFKLAGSSKEYCRKGFMCHIRVYDWEEQVILRHENTIPQAVNDRIELLENTQLHASATHGLYTDPTFALERYMDEAIQQPLYETEDYQGVRDVMACIQDYTIVQRFMDVLQQGNVILADGHHRYEGSLVYKHKQQAANPAHTGREGYNYHLMYLTNTEADDLRILPTHRLIHGLKDFDEQTILRRLEADFTIIPLDDADTLPEVIVGKRWAFGLMFRDNAYKVRLKPEALDTMPWPFPPVVKALDLTVMHYFIIEKALGIPGREQRSATNVSFDRSFADCMKKVLQQEAQLAVITNEVSIDEVKAVCHSGYTMPQKSTYFYPKVIGGYLFSSISESEFALPVCATF
ncbi:DUF1015 family protein [Fulvivirgaceae bacterium PWU5]|uniref:DUF1015 family protein n=1 Tax=Dawidia cretensis TaxID=2782350 RepID=A0AAP2DYQ5_9BACT|nr:DUF1015 domain-containing protein [Dawidia cretensis]MBT1708497.1 DUF1015 family protein [Dawidia cretensis]